MYAVRVQRQVQPHGAALGGCSPTINSAAFPAHGSISDTNTKREDLATESNINAQGSSGAAASPVHKANDKLALPDQACTSNLKVPKPGSIAVEEVLLALHTENASVNGTLIKQLQNMEQHSSGALGAYLGCGKIMIKDHYLLYGEVRCYCYEIPQSLHFAIPRSHIFYDLVTVQNSCNKFLTNELQSGFPPPDPTHKAHLPPTVALVSLQQVNCEISNAAGQHTISVTQTHGFIHPDDTQLVLSLIECGYHIIGAILSGPQTVTAGEFSSVDSGTGTKDPGSMKMQLLTTKLRWSILAPQDPRPTVTILTANMRRET